jgi:RimJ/RimL family protein N-acetyltransferase
MRPEEHADTEFLFQLFRSYKRAELAALPIDDAQKDTLVRIQFTAQMSGYRAQFPDAFFYLLEHAQAPIGRLVIDQIPTEANIVDFVLMPQWRNQGAGRAVLSEVVTALGRHSSIVRCKVLATNEASLRMCRSIGFARTGETPPFVDLAWFAPERGADTGTGR